MSDFAAALDAAYMMECSWWHTGDTLPSRDLTNFWPRVTLLALELHAQGYSPAQLQAMAARTVEARDLARSEAAKQFIAELKPTPASNKAANTAALLANLDLKL